MSITAEVAAQTTPPRPAVRVTQMPQLAFGIWPADFNGDGRTDLIGARRSPTSFTGRDVAIAIGRGDGTFDPLRSLGVNAVPVGVADFNNDSRLDVVVSGHAILPGNGNGTFGAPRPVTGPPAPGSVHVVTQDVLAADFDGDGNRDLVIPGDPSSGGPGRVYPGHGDFTFGPPVTLPSSGDVFAVVGADFNGDGRRDIAAISEIGPVDVFLNGGGMLFTVAATIPLEPCCSFFRAITAGDLNGDGRQDLVVSHSEESAAFGPGHIVVMLGNGNGTFQSPVVHDVGVNGTLTAVVVDFNRDGLLDVATGNRSWRMFDLMCASGFQYWDSVTVLPGLGNGSFGAPATFRLDNTPAPPSVGPFANTHNALKVSDFNGDGRPDLFTSPGALVLNVPPSANRLPAVFAGPDQMIRAGDSDLRIDPFVVELDWDWLTFEWRDQTGRLLAESPQFCPSAFPSTTELTLTVTDSRGGTGTDSLTIVVPPFRHPFLEVSFPAEGQVFGTASPVPIQWSFGVHDDTTAPPVVRFRLSSSSNNGQTWSVIPECASLHVTRDSCEWLNPGPVTDLARVRVEALDAAGNVVVFDASDRFRIVSGPRQALPPQWTNGDIGLVQAEGSASFDGTTFTVTGSGADIWGTADEFHYARMFAFGDFAITARLVSVDNVNVWTKAGLMIRSSSGSASAAHVSIFGTPTTQKPVSFQRRRTEGGSSVHTSGPIATPPLWLRLVRRGTTVSAYYRKLATDPWTLVGTDTIGGTTVLVGLAVSSHVDGRLATARFDNVSVDRLDFTSTDIGAVGVPGQTTQTAAGPVIEGSGADIWGSADAFRFHYTRLAGNVSITTRVRSIENTNQWAKAGVMFRESLAANSKQVMAIVSATRGLAMQYRGTTGGSSANAGLRAGTAPEWLRLTRAGNLFTAEVSENGVAWTTLGSVSVSMTSEVYVGLAVTSHNNATLATAEFDEPVIQR